MQNARDISDQVLLNENVCALAIKNSKNGLKKVLDAANSELEFICPFFLAECATYPEKVLEWMKCQKYLNERMGCFIISKMKPDSDYVKNSESSIWQPLLICALGLGLPYYIFMYVLGLNWTDACSLEYLKKGFYPIYQTLENNNIGDNDWIKLSQYVDKSSKIPSWDKCKMLRKGLVKHLKQSNYTMDALYCFTPDEDLNKKILKSF